VATEATGTPAAELEQGVQHELGDRGVFVELECYPIRQVALHTSQGGGVKGSCRQGGPGRKIRPQGGSPHDGLARGEQALFAQESQDPVRGHTGRDDGDACLVRKSVLSLLGDLESA
jgi:hypothetical protein